MKAYLIARVSTDEQKDALPAQVYRLQTYAERQGYDYVLYQFQESAYKDHRRQFKDIVDAIQLSQEKVIVAFDKIDRYTRDSSSEEVRILQKLCKTGMIELHFPSDNLYIHKDSPATDWLRLGMGVVVAQYYSDAVSDNVKRRFEQKLRDGEWIGQAHIGYKNTVTAGDKKWIEIDAFKAEAVREAFTMYASGSSSLREICKKWLADYQIQVGSSQMDLILKNPFYYGEMRVKGKLYPHKYDTIISRELYDQAERVRNGYKVKPHRWGGLPYAYRGLMTCADCGCRITFEKKKGTYVYGHCTQSKGKHGATYVLEEDLTKQLMTVFQSVTIPDYAYDQVSTALRQVHEDKKHMRDQTLGHIDAEIEKYQKRIEHVYEDYLDEKIPEDLYKRKFEEYRKAQKALQNKRVNIEQVEDDYYGTVNHLLMLAKQFPKLFEKADPEQKRSLINMILSNLELKGNLLRWELKKPFDTMAFCSENGNWLRELDSNQRPGD
jgi:site-specific DNA recombinase